MPFINMNIKHRNEYNNTTIDGLYLYLFNLNFI